MTRLGDPELPLWAEEVAFAFGGTRISPGANDFPLTAAEPFSGGPDVAEGCSPRTFLNVMTVFGAMIGLAAWSRAPEPTDVTLVELIANTDKFDGQLIRVIGFLRLAFEGNVLYLHRDYYERSLIGNGVWVDVDSGDDAAGCNAKQGIRSTRRIFSSKDHGHMEMWKGTIREIRRAEVWFAGNVR